MKKSIWGFAFLTLASMGLSIPAHAVQFSPFMAVKGKNICSDWPCQFLPIQSRGMQPAFPRGSCGQAIPRQLGRN